MQGVPEPFVLDPDGRLDLSSMQIDPKVIIVNGKRALLDSQGHTKRTLAELRDLFGDQELGTMHVPFKVAKGLPLQFFSPIEPPSFASGSRTSTLLYPVYSQAEAKPDPGSIPTSIPGKDFASVSVVLYAMRHVYTDWLNVHLAIMTLMHIYRV